jgi:hypothetical protein
MKVAVGTRPSAEPASASGTSWQIRNVGDFEDALAGIAPGGTVRVHFYELAKKASTMPTGACPFRKQIGITPTSTALADEQNMRRPRCPFAGKASRIGFGWNRRGRVRFSSILLNHKRVGTGSPTLSRPSAPPGNGLSLA